MDFVAPGGRVGITRWLLTLESDDPEDVLANSQRHGGRAKQTLGDDVRQFGAISCIQDRLLPLGIHGQGKPRCFDRIDRAMLGVEQDNCGTGTTRRST